MLPKMVTKEVTDLWLEYARLVTEGREFNNLNWVCWLLLVMAINNTSINKSCPPSYTHYQ